MCLVSRSFEFASYLPFDPTLAVTVAEFRQRIPAHLQGKGTPESQMKTIRNTFRKLTEQGHICRVEGGRAARFYKKPHLNSVDAKRLNNMATSGNRKSNIASLEKLSDFQLQERLVSLNHDVVLRLNDELIERISIIKDAILHKRKLVFSYVKGNRTPQERTVEPIGLIKNTRHTVLIAFNERGQKRVYTVMKMHNLFKSASKHFIYLPHDEALNILNSGIDEYYLTEHQELIELELRSKAVDRFSEEKPRFCDDWQFAFIDASYRRARVSFKRRLTVKFIEDLMSLGNYVKVLGSERLIVEIRNNQLDLDRVG